MSTYSDADGDTVRLDSIERAIADIRDGKAVVVVDDPGRENEGDIIFAASKATPELMGFLIRHSSGYVCAPAPGAVLDRLGIAHLADRHIRELSGGQQQRMFLARALLRDPQLLLLDEPTSGVDVATRHEMLHLLGHLHDDGMTILLTTHDLNGVAAHVPDLVAMNGTVLRRGAPADVMTPTVLEQTFGAPMDVLEHLGMPVVLDRKRHPRRPVVEAP